MTPNLIILLTNSILSSKQAKKKQKIGQNSSIPLGFITKKDPEFRYEVHHQPTHLPRLQRSLYALLTTKWPVWQALDRIQKPPVQEVLRTEEGALDTWSEENLSETTRDIPLEVDGSMVRINGLFHLLLYGIF